MNTSTLALQRILCIGGGPAGLYFGLLMKRRFPHLQVTVVERNRPFDTFGWGVVFSDQTLQNLKVADPESAQEMQGAFNHWDDIEVFYKGGRDQLYREIARQQSLQGNIARQDPAETQ